MASSTGTNGANSQIILNRSDITTNRSTIITNYGDIDVNYGHIITNYGDIDKNFGTIVTNYGDIDANQANANITTNYGDIDVNSAHIVTNYGDIDVQHGVISGLNWGRVGRNPSGPRNQRAASTRQNTRSNRRNNRGQGATIINGSNSMNTMSHMTGVSQVMVNGTMYTGNDVLVMGNRVRINGVWQDGPFQGGMMGVPRTFVSGSGATFNFNVGMPQFNVYGPVENVEHSEQAPLRSFPAVDNDSPAHLIASSIADIVRRTNPGFVASLSAQEQEQFRRNPPPHLPPNYAHVAGIVYRAITVSNDQMWSDILSEKFNLNPSNFEDAWVSSLEKSWGAMDAEEQWAAFGRAKDQWTKTLEEVSSILSRDDKFQEQGVAHFNQRFDALRKQFVEQKGTHNMSVAIAAVLNFLVDFSLLISDVTYVLNHAFKPNLIELQGLPDRAVVLLEILQRVPRDIELESAIKTTLFDLPDKNADCAICLSKLGEEIDVKALRALQRECVGKPGYLSWITLAGENTTAFKIKDGLSGVPVKMKCGHHFCAGCINKWLESAGKLQCPFRDQDYGVHRSPTVAEMETLCREYHYGDSRAGVGANVREDQVGLLTRLLRVLRLA